MTYLPFPKPSLLCLSMASLCSLFSTLRTAMGALRGTFSGSQLPVAQRLNLLGQRHRRGLGPEPASPGPLPS